MIGSIVPNPFVGQIVGTDRHVRSRLPSAELNARACIQAHCSS